MEPLQPQSNNYNYYILTLWQPNIDYSPALNSIKTKISDYINKLKDGSYGPDYSESFINLFNEKV